MGSSAASLFVDTNNSVYVAINSLTQAQAWVQPGNSSPKIFSTGSNAPWSLFVASNGDIYVDNGYTNHEVTKWIWNTTSFVTIMSVNSTCHGLFIDFVDNLYCSMGALNLVTRQSLTNYSSAISVVAGNGTAGSAAHTLNEARGICVDFDLRLYVADCFNDRIQCFALGQLNATTVVGAGSPGTMTLLRPMGVALDGSGYLFIADTNNNRVIGSGTDGFRCIVGCSATGGSSFDQLHYPQNIQFDIDGNLFVADTQNARIQKFFLASNSCGKYNSQVSHRSLPVQ